MSLEEKDVLLREIHHRVKNNLQVVSTLLSLQAEQSGDAATMEMFRNSQSRIKSMALVHEGLYHSPNVARINFEVYIKNLTDHLFHSHEVESDRIRLAVELEDIGLPIDIAIPCGLIVNEIVTNARSMPSPREGRARSACSCEGGRHHGVPVHWR